MTTKDTTNPVTGAGVPLPTAERLALDQLAREVAAKGAAGDPITMVLAKGMSDGLAKLTELSTMLAELAKGKAKASDDDEEPDGDEGDPDEGGGDGGGKDDAPGYEDMDKGKGTDLGLVTPPATGSAAPVDPAKPPTVLDVTNYMFETGNAVRRLEKAAQDGIARETQMLALIKSQGELIERQQQQISQLGQMIEAASVATMSTLVPLAKAVSETRAVALDIPAPSRTPTRFPAKPPNAPDAAFLGGDKGAEARLLMKAVNRSVLSSELLQQFKATRRFYADDSQNAAKRAEIEALGAPAAAA